MACSGRGYVTIVGRKRLCHNHESVSESVSESVTKVGIELLGQLKITYRLHFRDFRGGGVKKNTLYEQNILEVNPGDPPVRLIVVLGLKGWLSHLVRVTVVKYQICL